MCNPMQSDRFLNRILAGYFFFFLEGKCQNKTILREEFGIVLKFNFPQEGKRSRLPLPSYIHFSPLIRQYFLEKITRLHREKYKLGYRLGKNAKIKHFFFLNLKTTSLNKGDKYLSIELRRKKNI